METDTKPTTEGNAKAEAISTFANVEEFIMAVTTTLDSINCIISDSADDDIVKYKKTIIHSITTVKKAIVIVKKKVSNISILSK